VRNVSEIPPQGLVQQTACCKLQLQLTSAAAAAAATRAVGLTAADSAASSVAAEQRSFLQQSKHSQLHCIAVMDKNNATT
jgi:hypothetical protein